MQYNKTFTKNKCSSLSYSGLHKRSRLIEIDNKKGTGFQSSDFETLCRLATKARLDKDFWSLED